MEVSKKTKLTNQQILDLVVKDQIRNDLPQFNVGDYISVSNRITENKKTRIQKFDGIVMRIRGSGISKTFLVRKESLVGVYVERNFQYHSPHIEKIEIIRRGKVRRAFLTYLRERSGKSARIKEKIVVKKPTDKTTKAPVKKATKPVEKTANAEAKSE